MSSSHRGIFVANGFGHGSLTVSEARALYDVCYPVPVRHAPIEQWWLEDGGEQHRHPSSAHAGDGALA
jgi:hypothetical protein